MKRLLLSALLSLALVPAAPQPARAGCLEDAIQSCDEDFPGSDEKTIAIRGWCYLIRWGLCEADEA